MMHVIVYVVIHFATYEDGTTPNYDDNMIGCFGTLPAAKKAQEIYC